MMMVTTTTKQQQQEQQQQQQHLQNSRCNSKWFDNWKNYLFIVACRCYPNTKLRSLNKPEPKNQKVLYHVYSAGMMLWRLRIIFCRSE